MRMTIYSNPMDDGGFTLNIVSAPPARGRSYGRGGGRGAARGAGGRGGNRGGGMQRGGGRPQNGMNRRPYSQDGSSPMHTGDGNRGHGSRGRPTMRGTGRSAPRYSSSSRDDSNERDQRSEGGLVSYKRYDGRGPPPEVQQPSKQSDRRGESASNVAEVDRDEDAVYSALVDHGFDIPEKPLFSKHKTELRENTKKLRREGKLSDTADKAGRNRGPRTAAYTSTQSQWKQQRQMSSAAANHEQRVVLAEFGIGDDLIKASQRKDLGGAAEEESHNEGDATNKAEEEKRIIHSGAEKQKARSEEDIKAGSEKIKQLSHTPLSSELPLVDDDTLGLRAPISEALRERMNIERLTYIQLATWNAVEQMRSENMRCDLQIRSETGSGKTLAYLIPVVDELLAMEDALDRKISRHDGTLALVLVPTRELCIQILKVLEKLTQKFPQMVCGTVMGGEKMKSEKARLRKGVTILVATPGRILDHLRHTKSFNLAKLSFLIMDEADRLLDLGFEQDVMKIVEYLNAETRPLSGGRRMSILASATLRKGLTKLTEFTLVHPIAVGYDEGGDSNAVDFETTKEKKDDDADAEEKPAATGKMSLESFNIPVSLRQYYALIPSKGRLAALISFVRSRTLSLKKCSKLLVFANCCDEVVFLFNLFANARVTAHPEEVDLVVLDRGNASASQDPQTRDTASPGVKRPNWHRQHAQTLAGMYQARSCVQGADPALPGQSGNANNTDMMIPVPLFQLHGNMTQKTRTDVYFEFQKAQVGVLICTDVAARGLDFPNVQWVVQYDAPTETKEYLHRIGRTARMGKVGDSILFLRPEEKEYVEFLRKYGLDLKGVASDALYEPLTSLVRPPHAAKSETFSQTLRGMKGKDIGRQLQQAIESAVTPQRKPRKKDEDDEEQQQLMQMQMQMQVQMQKSATSGKEPYNPRHDPLLYKCGCIAYQSFLSSYATHTRDTKAYFHPKLLHMGHLANSFGLRDTPAKITRIASTVRRERDHALRELKRHDKVKNRGGRKQREQAEERENADDVDVDSDSAMPGAGGRSHAPAGFGAQRPADYDSDEDRSSDEEDDSQPRSMAMPPSGTTTTESVMESVLRQSGHSAAAPATTGSAATVSFEDDDGDDDDEMDDDEALQSSTAEKPHIPGWSDSEDDDNAAKRPQRASAPKPQQPNRQRRVAIGQNGSSSKKTGVGMGVGVGVGAKPTFAFGDSRKMGSNKRTGSGAMVGDEFYDGSANLAPLTPTKRIRKK